jgi:radical SAM protein with 4Fe4S-binding SPASM domain
MHILKNIMKNLRDVNIDKLKNSDTFCLAPWIHCHIEADGKVSPCCLTGGRDYSYGSIHEKSLKEIWNSEKIKDIRLDMLNEIKRPECSECHTYDKIGKISYREELNSEFSSNFELLKYTESDGTFEKFNLVYWDFRLSNVCNFKCRSCSEKNSTSWARELLEQDPELNIPILLDVDNNPSLWEEIEDLYLTVEKIYFAGGEPLIMDSHYKILDKLIEYERYDVKLVYTTNFSTLTYKDKNILDYWEKFSNISISVSVDGFGERGELIRKGFNWNNFISNVKQFHQRFEKFNFNVICTTQLLNSLHVIDLHKKLYEEGIIKNLNDFTLNYLFIPEYLSLNCLPYQVKSEVFDKIKDHIKNYLKPKGAEISEYVSYAKFITSKSSINQLTNFIHQMQYLDKIRNENTRTTFPEFEETIWKPYLDI